MSNKKLQGLKLSAVNKRKVALQKTKEAINNLIENSQKITITSVARLAGVSTSYIYKYPELSYQIQTLREQQKYDRNSEALATNKQNQIKDKDSDRIKILEQEKIDLTKEIKTLNQTIEHIINSDKSVEQLQANNAKLTLENQRLRQQLERLEQEVYELRGAILDRGYIDDRDRKTEIKPKQKTIQVISEKTKDTSKTLPESKI